MQNDKVKFKTDFIKRLIKFSVEIIKFCDKLKQKKVFWSIIDQLVRSSTSIGANVTEAKAASSKRDYLRFFEIALKSANETKYWLMVIEESYPGFKEDIRKFYQEVEEISKVLGSSVLTLKGKK